MKYAFESPVSRRLAPAVVPGCASCGAQHRLAWRIGPDTWFCRGCIDAVTPSDFDELYVDLGGGD